MNTKQKILYSSEIDGIIWKVFSAWKLLGCILLFLVFSVISGSSYVCAATDQSQDSPISIVTTQPMPGTPLSLSINTSEKYVIIWYVDDTKVTTAESYTPTTSDYEKWIKVVLVSVSSSKVLGEDSIYFSKLPVIYINTDDGGSITTKVDKTADMDIQGNSQYAAQYSGDVTVKVRGNSSSYFPQKPYKIKLDTSTDLFGMGKSKHWVLITNYMDQCGLRNMLGSSMSKQLGLTNMDMVYVDVVINGKYAGFYELSEHIRIGDNRIDIYNWKKEAENIAKKIYKGNKDTLSEEDRDAIEDQLCKDLSWITNDQLCYQDEIYHISDYYEVSDNITGGYLFELSDEYDEVSKFVTSGGIKVMVNSPEYINTCDSAMDYIKKYWQNFENAIQSKDGYNSNSVHYSELADFDSMVSYWLTMEILGNVDAFSKSRFAYKDVDGLLTFGPVWDFDWGCASYTVSTLPKGWKLSTGTLWKDFIDDPYFQVKAAEKYWTNRDYLENLIEDGGTIDEIVGYLSESGTLSDAVYPNLYYGDNARRTFHTDAVIFKTYLKDRVAWLDQVFATADDTTAAMKLSSSTNPYTKSSEKLGITITNAKKDTVSTNASADGVIYSDSTAEIRVSVSDQNTEKIVVYVNGRILDNYDVIDSVCTFSVPQAALTEEMGTQNVISLIAYNASNQVTYTNYASVIVAPGSYIRGTPYTIKNDKFRYDVTVPHILINQAYGGSSDGYATHDFIELYNPTSFDIDLSTWSLQYRSSKDGADQSAWSKLDLTGIIPAHSSYLVRCSAIADPAEKAISIDDYDQEWNQVIHDKGISIALIANQDLLDADTDLYDNDKHTPLIPDYVDLYSISGNDTKLARQKAPYSENAASAIQSKEKTIRRVKFTDTDDNTVAGDFEVIDYSFAVDSYIDWIRPRSSLDGVWNAKSNVRPSYSVSYECGEDSSRVPAEEYGLYETIVKPEDPIREYHDFAGWYTDKELTNEYDFENQDPPKANVILYAKWMPKTYKVTYESGGGSEVADQVYVYDEDMVEPENPIREGHTFTAWYRDEELTKQYKFGKMPAKDIILYAGWEVNTYSVTYETNGGSELSDDVYLYGEDMVAPENPIREGYIFTAWYEDERLTKIYLFDKMPAKDIVLYAGWIEDQNKDNTVPNTINNGNTSNTVNTVCQLTAVYRKAVANNKAKKVNAKNVKSITLYTRKLKTAQLSVNGTNHSVQWSSSNVAVAKVSKKGKVTAVGKGTAYITATVDAVSYRCKIVVKKAEISFAHKNRSVKMRVGAKQKIRANVVPKGIISYKTSNKKIVSVSKKGVMKAKAAGKATLTVKANGIKKKLKVIVKR